MKHDEEQNSLSSIAEISSKAASFFSINYAIILTLSISYNVGYFKEINPQIVDLMGLGDYIDDTIHNLWFFLLAALLSFSTSVALLKRERDSDFFKLIIFGSFALVMSSYFLLKDISYSKLWPIIKKLLIKDSATLYIWLICGLILIMILVVYSYVSKIFRNHSNSFSIGIIPIVIYLAIVLAPYLGGLLHGYIETNEMHKKEFIAYSVNVTLMNEQILKNVILVKKLDKGILIRGVKEEDNKNRFVFINWGTIKQITYYKMTNT